MKKKKLEAVEEILDDDDEDLYVNPNSRFDDPNTYTDGDKTVYDDTYDDYRINNSADADLTRILVETDTLINRIELTLENKYLKQLRTVVNGKDEISNIPTQYEGTKPLMNKNGISQCIGKAKAMVHNAIGSGNIDDDYFKTFCGKLIIELARTIVIHRKEWEIEENSLRDIRFLIQEPVMMFMTRPKGDRERAYNRGLMPENYGQNQTSNRDGMINNFVNKFKKNRGQA